MIRGCSDIYDIFIYFIFMYIELEKICCNSEIYRGEKCWEWKMFEEIVWWEEVGLEFNKEVVYIYLSSLFG